MLQNVALGYIVPVVQGVGVLSEGAVAPGRLVIGPWFCDTGAGTARAKP